MTDLDFDAEAKGRLVRGAKIVATREELDFVAQEATRLGVTQAAMVRGLIRSGRKRGAEAEARESEAELTSRRKVGAAKTNRKR